MQAGVTKRQRGAKAHPSGRSASDGGLPSIERNGTRTAPPRGTEPSRANSRRRGSPTAGSSSGRSANATPEEAKALSARLYAMLPRDTDHRTARRGRQLDRLRGPLHPPPHRRCPRPTSRRCWPPCSPTAPISASRAWPRPAAALTLRRLAWTADWHVREETYTGAWRRSSTRTTRCRSRASGGRRRLVVGRPVLPRRWPRRGDHPRQRALRQRTRAFCSTPTSPTATGPSTPRSSPRRRARRRTCSTGCSIMRASSHRASITPTRPVATDQVFALCALLGFRFAPRIRDLADRRLYSFDPPPTYRRSSRWSPAASTRTLIARQLGRDPAPRRLDPARHRHRLLHAEAARRLPAAERPRRGAARDRPDRADALHPRLACGPGAPPPHPGPDSTRASPATSSPAPCSSTASARSATAPSRTSSIAPRAQPARRRHHPWNTRYLGRAVEALRDRGEDVPDELLAHVCPTRLGARRT